TLAPCEAGLHGEQEMDAFARLRQDPAAQASTDALCRLTLLGMLPALIEADCRAFGEALFEFNRRAGELFAPVQGGPYAHPSIAELVAWLRRQGAVGAGQSSWGPAVFAVTDCPERAEWLRERLSDHDGGRPVWVARASPHGAILSSEPVE